MNGILKKRIVNISSDFLSFLALVAAFFCLITKIRSSFRLNVEGISVAAAKSVFPRGNIKIFSKFKNISHSKTNINFKEELK